MIKVHFLRDSWTLEKQRIIEEKLRFSADFIRGFFSLGTHCICHIMLVRLETGEIQYRQYMIDEHVPLSSVSIPPGML